MLDNRQRVDFQIFAYFLNAARIVFLLRNSMSKCYNYEYFKILKF